MTKSNIELGVFNRLISSFYNYTLDNFKEKSLFSRVVTSIYYRLQYGRLKNIPVRSQLNNYPFQCPFSHQLLFNQKAFKLYDKQLPKLCSYIKGQLNRPINIIDVGANVGDTVINIGIKDAFYLCIEGNESFFRYIQINLADFNYSLEKCFLGDTDENLPYGMTSNSGTGHLVKNKDNSSNTQLFTLDRIIEEKYSNIVFDILKIDTDGFDFKVIRGSRNVLHTHHPLLFFEWDKAYLEEQHEDSISIFPFLYECGYTECILFDSYGNLIGKVRTDENNILKTFIDISHLEGHSYYYDILVIPNYSVFNTEHLCSIFSNNK